ncbi:MAG: DUF2785 domain-containing protein [Vitreoscilla sp.]|nr:DUF2785 domain-containing protein [Vitreoscilla sp.]
MHRLAGITVGLLLCGAAQAGCPPEGQARANLLALKATTPEPWAVGDEAARRALALGLLGCLADPDPVLRDELAFEALSHWMRSKQLPPDTVRDIADRLQPQLIAADPQGFAAPFAALVLAEVARVDRLAPLFSAHRRQALVDAAAGYLAGVRDYRGFDPRQGWRHGVAHAADLAMQLALNPLLDKPQLDTLLRAVQAQALASGGHSYIFGEGERLARPVIFAARRGLHSAADWSGWFGVIAAAAAPAPGQATDAASLARLHNAREFFWPLYVALQEGQDAALRERLLPGVLAALKALP